MNTSSRPTLWPKRGSSAHGDPTDYVAVTYVSFWAEGVIRGPARLNLSTGVVDEIERFEDGDDFEHLLEEGIESPSRQFYARTVFCRRLSAYRIKRTALAPGFSADHRLHTINGDIPPHPSEYASSRHQPAWSPDRHERLANLIRARLILDAEARGEACDMHELPRISCRLNQDTRVIELFEISKGGDT